MSIPMRCKILRPSQRNTSFWQNKTDILQNTMLIPNYSKMPQAFDLQILILFTQVETVFVSFHLNTTTAPLRNMVICYDIPKQVKYIDTHETWSPGYRKEENQKYSTQQDHLQARIQLRHDHQD